ncbi:hypothetical protein FB451DRAFT_1526874, partial [Mycena latifolia]
ATLEACVSPEQATARLYGPVYSKSQPFSVHIAASVRDSTASFALWWGEGSKRNCSHILLNTRSVAKAYILAVLCAVKDGPRDKSLVVYLSSEYVIRALCYWAGDNATRGWTCANGDELSAVADWLAWRRAPVEFRWVSAKDAGIGRAAAARVCAKAA